MTTITSWERIRTRGGVHKKELMKMLNVCGMKEDKNEVTVFVTKKMTPEKMMTRIDKQKDPMTSLDVVPKEVKVNLIKKKKTNVIQVGHIKALIDRKKYRPVNAGCEIGILGYPYVGTLGMFVKIFEFRGLKLIGPFASFLPLLRRANLIPTYKVFALSNSHVSNKDITKPKHEDITQPGHSTIGNKIGTVFDSALITKEGINNIDASLIELENVVVNDGIMGSDKITGIDSCKIGEKVHKRGRTTELTSGEVIAKDVFMTVDYGGSIGGVVFAGLDMFSYMSKGGDSGSVIVRDEDNKAVSLLFAGSDSITLGIPMNRVKKHFQFEI